MLKGTAVKEAARTVILEVELVFKSLFAVLTLQHTNSMQFGMPDKIPPSQQNGSTLGTKHPDGSGPGLGHSHLGQVQVDHNVTFGHKLYKFHTTLTEL